ncbi:MAG: CoA-binding protein [Magnetovibrio sp.]|nr:CoA-binding protein [Magnetovibrio sp.]
MSELSYDDAHMRRILREVRTIAMVGASPNWVRPSNFAMKYLQGKGYKVIPLNPGQAGKEILGEPCYASVAEIPGTVDMIDIFRNSEAAGAVVNDILPIASEKKIRVIWMQLGIRNDNAAARAKAAGLTVIMDRCPKIEYGRLFGELSWSGVNSGIITSKRRKLSA